MSKIWHNLANVGHFKQVLVVVGWHTGSYQDRSVGVEAGLSFSIILAVICYNPPSHIDVVVRCELQVHRLDAWQSQDGDVDVDQERISSPGAGTQLVGINLRNLEILIFHFDTFMVVLRN